MKENIKAYIKKWELRCYFDGIPNEVEPRLTQLNKVPSYKAICSAILKNDNNLKTLGVTTKKSLFYNHFKRIEIDERNKNKFPKQGKLF